MKGKFKYGYCLLLFVVLAISTIGSTYAYFTATTGSANEEISASSTTYSISMDILPLYSGFSFIPMDDNDALKALENKCRDKFDRGACSAYNIRVFAYNSSLNYVSGSMDVNLDNIENLSYMMLEESDEYVDGSCSHIEDKVYCIAKEATRVLTGNGLSLGDMYDVSNTTEKNLLLLIWLTNLEQSQNDNDIGNFDAVITFSMGNGGEIKGSISNALIIDNDDKLQSGE